MLKIKSNAENAPRTLFHLGSFLFLSLILILRNSLNIFHFLFFQKTFWILYRFLGSFVSSFIISFCLLKHNINDNFFIFVLEIQKVFLYFLPPSSFILFLENFRFFLFWFQFIWFNFLTYNLFWLLFKKLYL